METKNQSKGFGGLVRKVVAPMIIGAASLIPAKADAGMIYMRTTLSNPAVNSPDVTLNHSVGGHEWFVDPEDTLYSNISSPAVDFYSILQSQAIDLSVDTRDQGSTSTFFTKMQGRGLPGTVYGRLNFYIDGLNEFSGTPILADVSKNGEYLSTIDVKAYAANPTSNIPLQFDSNNDFYNIDVKFATPEPSTLSLLAMAGLAGAGVAAYNLSKRKQ